jgi:formylglycine-generating enzyme required for sulfatase activity
VLVGEESFLDNSRKFFSTHVKEATLWAVSDEPENNPGLDLPIQALDSWCLVCDMITSDRSLAIARRLLQNTSNIPFIVLIRDPGDLTDALLKELLELGVTHALVMPRTWIEAWAELREALARRLNPMISVRSTKTWLVGVLQSVAAQERDCCVRIAPAPLAKGPASELEAKPPIPVSTVGLLGEIFFHEGQPVYGWSMRSRGDEAVMELLQTSTIQITITHIGWIPFPPNIKSTLQGLLLEYMKREDHTRRMTVPETGAPAPGGPQSPVFLDREDPISAPLPLERPPRSLGAAPKKARSSPWLWGLGITALLAIGVLGYLKGPGTRGANPDSVPAHAAAPPSDLRVPAPGIAAKSSPDAGAAPSEPAPSPERPPSAPGAPSRPSEEKPPEPPKTAAPAQELALTLGNRVQLEAVLIPAGKFRMGASEQELGWERDEGPMREITVSPAFYMGRYEVTQEQFEEVMGQNPSQFKGPRRPVESVSSYEAIEFCERLTKKSGRRVRLPTEVEWEYACRAGTTGPFHFGASIGADRANFDGRVGYGGQRGSLYRRTTLDVGSFPPNAFGLYDMHGNVGEWCLDYYDSRAYEKSGTTPVPESPTHFERVWRGGAYNDPPRRIRSAFREHFNPGGRDSFRGFRVVISIEESAPTEKHP